MGEMISRFFLEIVGEELCVFFCSMLPIIELRGAIPMAFALGLPWWQAYLISVLGNLLPVPFILLLINVIIKWMAASKVKFFNKIAHFLLERVEKKREKIEKYNDKVKASPRKAIDKLGGSIVRRGMMGEHLDYWTSIMLSSIKSGKRIPDDVRELPKKEWW